MTKESTGGAGRGDPDPPLSSSDDEEVVTDVLFDILAGDRLPALPLDAGAVPSEAMVLAVDAATARLVSHSRFCNQPHCHHLPAPLSPFRKMREKAIAKGRGEIYATLWTHADHEFVKAVRDDVLEAEAVLADAVESGEALEGRVLRGILDEPMGVARMTAVLWARGLGAHQELELYRRLVVVGSKVHSSRPKASGRDKSDDAGELKKIRRDLKQRDRELRETKKTVVDRDRGMVRRAEELAAAIRERDDAVAEVERLSNEHRATGENAQRVQTQLNRSTEVNQQLRTEISRAREERDRVDRSMSRAVRELAAAHQEMSRLRAELTSRASGADAVWEFIKHEEERIDQNLAIDQGADRQRAEEEHAQLMKLERVFKAAYPAYSEDRPPAPVRRKSSLRFVALGGANEVGRSAYVITIGSRQILVDCGIKVGARDPDDFAPDLDRIGTLDAAVITHAHTDHIGWLPALIRREPDIDIYCTPATAELLPTMLRDGADHYLTRQALQRTHASYNPDASEIVDAYDREDVEETLFHLIKCEFGEVESLQVEDLTVQFFPAGHILGAASVLLEGGGRRVFLSGDISSQDQLTVPAASWPSGLDDVDLLVFESTYGGTSRKPAELARADLISKIRDVTLDRGGSVILASFALGRAQELLTIIHRAIEQGELPSSAPVCIDGMIRAINETYAAHQRLDLPPGAFTVGGQSERDDAIHRAKTTPTIIVTTSGMLAGGPVIEYSRRLLEDPRHRLILTGYQDEAAPSRALRAFTKPGTRSKVVELPSEDGGRVRFRAAAPAMDVGLSAHADQAGLVAYAGRVTTKTIALVHGETDAQEALRSQILRASPGRAVHCGPSELAVE